MRTWWNRALGRRAVVVSLLVGLGAALVLVPAGAASGSPPVIEDVPGSDQPMAPGESRSFRVVATGVDAEATVTFSGDGVSASIQRIRRQGLRILVEVDLSASAGPRDLMITNPDGLSATYSQAVLVTGSTETETGSITGRVFLDIDGNGQEDGIDTGLGAVELTSIDSQGATHSATTDSSGNYAIHDLPIGDATITFTAPAGHALTTGNATQSAAIEAMSTATTTPVGYEQSSDPIETLPDTTLPGGYLPGDVHFVLDARSLSLDDGTPVDVWRDELGGLEFSTYGGLGAPTYRADAGFGGSPSVEFDGIDDVLQAEFDELSTGDIAFQFVLETLTYSHRTVIMSAAAGSPLSTKHVLAYDDYDENDRTLRGEPAWATMSGPSGTQAQHYHPLLAEVAGHDRNSPTADTTGGANRVVITYVVRDSGQVRFWDRLDDLLDKTMSEPGNDLAGGLRLGSREDGTSFANFRLAYMIVLDGAPYTEAELLEAAADLAAWFDVPGMGVAWG